MGETMTAAVCFCCGYIKHGALTPCDECGEVPVTRDEIITSVAYYDAQHRMTVAARTLDSDQWQYQVLPSAVGWDSHNYIVMALDSDGYLYLSGNMHCVPLIYFRTAKPGDITTLTRIPAMTGSHEDRCTYPHFMEGADGRLIFHYRDGSSGNGSEIYNVYDCSRKTWTRLLDKPLIDGEGQMNAYMSGPAKGPDGWFYLAWVWRDTPACETNHDPSCARSRDLINWETLSGKSIALPITIKTPGTLIDPVPAKGGIINGTLRIGFDSGKNPIATYHKFDSAGNTQAYAARFKEGQWKPQQISNWNYRSDFQGGGSIKGEIEQDNAASFALNPQPIKVYSTCRFYDMKEKLNAIRSLSKKDRDCFSRQLVEFFVN